MKDSWTIAVAVILAMSGLKTGLVNADDPATTKGPVKQTFLIEGLHCAPCTRTVEGGLTRTPGVQSASVDWSSKNAKIIFDESKISAQQIAQAIATTPHMMGRGMHYHASLALKVPSLTDEATGKKAQDALSGVPGVAKVYVYVKQQSVAVNFKPEGKLTTDDLIAALGKAGIEATPFR